jgi:hypothetical protein
VKIKLIDLKTNPYRDLKKYPIKQERVDALKASIQQTGFWDNVLARPSGKQYELAYGHNRLVALQQLGIEEIDIPIKDISDADMVRIMATENREQYDENQAILIETVQTVRDFLSRELAKYEVWEEAEKSFEFVGLFGKNNNPRASFAQVKSKGIGIQTICDFLGGGWKQWKIQHALEVINSTEINPEAIKEFQSTGMGVAFTKAIKEINRDSKKPVDFPEQMRLAEKLKENLETNKVTGRTGGGNYYTSIKDMVKDEVSPKYLPPAKKDKVPDERVRNLDSMIVSVQFEADLLSVNLAKLLQLKDILDTEHYQNSTGIKLLNMTLTNLKNQIIQLTNKQDETSKFTNTDFKSIAG